MSDTDQLFKSQDSFQNVMEYYSQLGFQKKAIWEAWKNTNHRQNLMLEELIRLTSESGQLSSIKGLEKLESQNKEDSQILKAINLSLKTFTTETSSEEYIRKGNHPVGLINLGRTCYFNVVIQTLFSIKEVRDLILNINLNVQGNPQTEPSLTKDGKNDKEEERQKFVNMTKQFQILFSCLLKGQKSHQNPRDLFDSLRDLNGEVFKIGEENDFWEFQNSTFELLEKSFSKLYNISESELRNTAAINSLFLSKLMPLSIQTDFFNKNLENDKKKELIQKQQNYNPMTDLFYGKVQECITYSEGNNELKKFNEYAQGIVSLEVKHGDLYKALESSQIFEIPDYEVQAGVKTKARVENKFKKAPQILNFNINRLDFDRKKLCTVKLNNQFYFEKELNLDNFCVQDDQLEGNLSREELSHLDKLNRQIKKVEEKLKECQNPNCAPIQLDSCFENVLSFLKRQQTTSDDFIDIDEYEMELEQADGQFGLLGSKQDLKTAIEMLTQYRQRICNQTESLNQKLEKLRKERWQIYRKSKKNFYELFSILMHEGTADSGHYYCYIWDEKAGKWFKYNDSTVTEAVEEDLLLEAYGRQDSTKNACCLFYRNKLHKTDYSKPTEIPPQLLEVIKQKDKQFLDEIDRSKVLNALEPFKRKLTQEISKRQSAILKHKDSLQCIIELTNFENFLLNLDQFKHYGVRDVLIQMLQESDQTVIKSQLKDPNNLDSGIEIFFQQLEKLYKIPSYKNMNESQLSEYSVLKEAHTSLLKLLKEFEMILRSFEKIDSYPNVLKSLCAIQLSLKDINPYITQNSLLGLRLSQATQYMLQVQLMKGCFNIDCNLQKQDVKDIVNTTNMMVLSLMCFFRNDEKLKKQIESNLKYTLDTHGTNPKIFSAQLNKDFQTSIEKISKINQLYEKNVYNLRDIFNLKYQNENVNWDSPVDKLEMSTSLLSLWERQLNVLMLWRNFLDKLTSQNALISNNERLDQEEILYSQYM